MHFDAFRFILMHCNTWTFRTWSTIDQILLKVAPNVAGECVLVTVVPFPRSVSYTCIHVAACFHRRYRSADEAAEDLRMLEAKK